MKKLKLFTFVFLLLFCFTSCGKKAEIQNEQGYKSEENIIDEKKLVQPQLDTQITNLQTNNTVDIAFGSYFDEVLHDYFGIIEYKAPEENTNKTGKWDYKINMYSSSGERDLNKTIYINKEWLSDKKTKIPATDEIYNNVCAMYNLSVADEINIVDLKSPLVKAKVYGNSKEGLELYFEVTGGKETAQSEGFSVQSALYSVTFVGGGENTILYILENHMLYEYTQYGYEYILYSKDKIGEKIGEIYSARTIMNLSQK